ncbi:MAG: dihydroorotase [Bacteroidales bacterium]|nr:dihydroorotase [Bacteroidales bacterium]
MPPTLLKNALIVTGTSAMRGALAFDGERITGIWQEAPFIPDAMEIDLGGRILMAGGIDAHVHFREPGLTWKADMESESRAAVLGGITTFIDMPNTAPPTTTIEDLGWKISKAAETSSANYGFHIGATNSNSSQIKDYMESGLGNMFAGIKVFMGSSTGNMLVDRDSVLEDLFRIKGKTILVHCEDEGTIKSDLRKAKNLYGDDIPFSEHPFIRSREACVRSTRKALDMAIRNGTRLHILHVSTKEEVQMIREAKLLNPGITAETSANYLWFSDEDYLDMGGRLKCNPAVKSASDREALIGALKDGTIDTIGSDHAPHLSEEKERSYLDCPSGLPTIQQSLPAVITIALREGIPLTRLASAFSEKASDIFGIKDRGRLEKGCYADLVVIDPDKEYIVGKPAYKCGWTPYEGMKFKGSVDMVWVNGEPIGTGKRAAMRCDFAPGQHSAR